MTLTDIRSPNVSRARVLEKPAVKGRGGIVAAQNRHAAHVGAEVLRAGGNAVDAAVATSFALGVLEPWMNGIGGVGAVLGRPHDGPVSSIDAGARSPAGLNPADFPLVEGKDGDLFGWPNVLEDRNVVGARSICIPGLVRGLGAAHVRFGRMPWADLVAPAVALAADGLVVDHHVTQWVAQEMARLQRNEACAAWFLPDGYPPVSPAAVTGEVARLCSPNLSATLARIAQEGPDALYLSDLAQDLTRDVQDLGGYLSAEDMAGFEAVEAPARSEPYRGHALNYVPDLNGGVSVALAMRLCNRDHRPAGSMVSPDDIMAYASAMAASWEHRFAELGDGAERTLPSCTTHFSVVDSEGMTVSLTQTLLSLFGSGVVSPSTGILLNNGVNWFDPRPGKINAIAPARKALANYSPVMLTGEDDVVAFGGSGGRKILPAVFQALARIADFDADLDCAIAAPRFDLSAPPVLVADPRFGADLLSRLAECYPVVLADRIDHPNHYTTLCGVRRKQGMNYGAAEPWHPWAEAVSEGESLFPED